MLQIAVFVVATTANEFLLFEFDADTIPETASALTEMYLLVSLTTTLICGSIEAVLASMDRSQHYAILRARFCLLLLLCQRFDVSCGVSGLFRLFLLRTLCNRMRG